MTTGDTETVANGNLVAMPGAGFGYDAQNRIVAAANGADQVTFTDPDRDGRPDVLFTTLQVGGSAHARHLNVISMHPDMKIRHHVMWSREPVRVLEENSVRPVFIQHDDDAWAPDDCGASVRARGYRKAYYRWTVTDGFVRF